jgi:hypothetical protein
MPWMLSGYFLLFCAISGRVHIVACGECFGILKKLTYQIDTSYKITQFFINTCISELQVYIYFHKLRFK